MTPPRTMAPEITPPEPRATTYPFWGYQDLALLAGLAIPCFLVAMVLAQLMSMALPADLEQPAVAPLAAQFLAYGLWFTCLWALFRVRYQQSLREGLLWLRPRRGMALYILLGLGLAISIAVLGAILQTPNVEMPMRELLGDRLSLVLVGTFAVTLGPVCEELAFRGFLLPVLARTLGGAVAVLVTSVSFALMHGPQYAWSWQHLALISLAGIAFGVTRLWTGSTAAAAAMHAGYNLTFFIAYLTQWEEFAS